MHNKKEAKTMLAIIAFLSDIPLYIAAIGEYILNLFK